MRFLNPSWPFLSGIYKSLLIQFLLVNENRLLEIGKVHEQFSPATALSSKSMAYILLRINGVNLRAIK